MEEWFVILSQTFVSYRQLSNKVNLSMHTTFQCLAKYHNVRRRVNVNSLILGTFLN